MNNFVQKGGSINLVAGGAITSGVPQFIGGMAVIPYTSGVSGDTIACATKGVFSLTKKDSLEVTQGDDLYWDADPGEITKTAADGVWIGKAFSDAAAAAATVEVDINAVKQAAFVADASAGSAAEINAVRDALVAAGLMAAS